MYTCMYIRIYIYYWQHDSPTCKCTFSEAYNTVRSSSYIIDYFHFFCIFLSSSFILILWFNFHQLHISIWCKPVRFGWAMMLIDNNSSIIIIWSLCLLWFEAFSSYIQVLVHCFRCLFFSFELPLCVYVYVYGPAYIVTHMHICMNGMYVYCVLSLTTTTWKKRTETIKINIHTYFYI